MAVANASTTARSPHVPAWKRLGLQLKYAKDTAEPPSNLQPPSHSVSTLAEKVQTTPAEVIVDNERPSKKRKTSPNYRHATQSDSRLEAKSSPSRTRSSQADERSAVSVSVETEPVREITAASTSESQRVSEDRRTNTIKRRKSVTFTEGTKVDDGNSAESFASPASDSTSSTAALSVSKASNTGEQPRTKAKRSKKESAGHTDNSVPASKKEKSSPKDSQPTESPEYRRYLEQFHQDKGSWKFNKNHQTSLLKNLFDIRAIPASLTPAAASYISGLQGAGSQERLIETATSILENFAEKDGTLNEIKEMNAESARREAYYRAMHREIKKWEEAGTPRSEYDDDQIADMNAEIERGRRAEEVLRALPITDSQAQSGPSSAQEAPAEISQGPDKNGRGSLQTIDTSASQSKTSSARKRKRRVDVQSDSSSSDSDSDTSSSDDEVATAAQPKRKEPISVSAAVRPTPAPERDPKAPPSRTPAYQHDNLNMAYRPQNPSQLMNASVKPTKKFFDDDLLDAAFPKKKTYHDVAPKRRKVDGSGKGKEKGRGFAYTHGTRVDESGSEDGE